MKSALRRPINKKKDRTNSFPSFFLTTKKGPKKPENYLFGLGISFLEKSNEICNIFNKSVSIYKGDFTP